ncbi:PAS domain S-box-containing protein [Breznakibacter xylanolyticus]|uniref:histidine kinase n=1 Tax=Breznakibacter xylanolyticus TaxID=990 RepID=A0A2W7N604_9BACT|nr:PAS domain S-box protein [Breznakibacter xylanolyticus]PZX15143.1 PAS domain S-box-containing protein [Breznakibacter xylanolyticus]
MKKRRFYSSIYDRPDTSITKDESLTFSERDEDLSDFSKWVALMDEIDVDALGCSSFSVEDFVQADWFQRFHEPMCLLGAGGKVLCHNVAFGTHVLSYRRGEDVLVIGQLLTPEKADWFEGLFVTGAYNHSDHLHHWVTYLSPSGELMRGAIEAYPIELESMWVLILHVSCEHDSDDYQPVCLTDKYKMAFEISPDVICITRLSDGFFVEVNDNFLKFSGYEMHEVIGKTSLDLNFWAEPQQRDILLQKLILEGSIDNVEIQFRLKDGSIAEAMVSMRTISVNHQAHLFLFARDIRYRKELEFKYRLLFENLSSGFALLESKFSSQREMNVFVFVDVNPAFETILGFTSDQIVGREINDVIPHLDVEMHDALLEVANDGQFKRCVDERFIEGKKFRIMVFCPKKGFIAILFEDITEMMRQQDELHERDEQLRQMFEHTHSVLMLLNRDGELVRLNRAGFELAAHLNSDYSGLRPGNLMNCVGTINNPRGCGLGPVCKTCRLRKMARETYVSGKSFIREEIWVSQMNQGAVRRLYLLVSISRLILKSGTHLLISIDDITRRKIMEDDLVSAKQRAEESDRLKTAFFSNLSHEIRTPLNGIIGFSNLLKKKDISPSDLSLYTHYINENSNRLLMIMNNVIELAQLNSHLMKIVNSEFDLEKAVVETLRIGKTMNPEKQLNVRYKIVGDKQVIGYPTVFTSALKQLVLNSYKFTLFGSIGVKCTTSAGRLCCIVADTGIGIEASFQDLIFEPFRQQEDGMTRNYGGIGLGLAIVKEYMKLVDGSITLKSIPGRGSVFRIEMPVMSSEQFDVSRSKVDFSVKKN